MKDSLRSENEKNKIMRLSSVKSNVFSIVQYFMSSRNFIVCIYKMAYFSKDVRKKCGIEIIDDPNDGKYFWLNEKHLEYEIGY